MKVKDNNVTKYLSDNPWETELSQLRDLALTCGLTESFKWRQPCYSFHGKNIVILGSFKSYCIISFFKGVLLKDDKSLLKKPGKNTRSGRIIPFTNVEEILTLETTLKAYIQEAIEVEKAGTKIPCNTGENTPIPEELSSLMKEDAAFKKAFFNLTPGRQRGYLIYFSGAKQSKTRASRIKKYKEQIIDGFGFHDCTCGLTQKPPNCDGSHKKLQKQ